MPSRSLLRTVLFCIAAALAVAPVARADLVWTPQTGWRIEGGALSFLGEEENQKAVDLMNRAREAEEKGHERTAIRNYNRVTKRYPRSIYAPEAFYRMGLLRLERKEFSRAFEAFDPVIRRYPTTAVSTS
jgi:outer membrane protein assembly factor BamD